MSAKYRNSIAKTVKSDKPENIEPLEDLQALSLIKSGNKVAFEAFFKKYYPLLFQYGKKLCSDAKALEDLIQDLFVKLWQTGASKNIESPKAYLLSSLRYKLYKQYRINQKQSDFPQSNVCTPFELSTEDFLITQEISQNKIKKIFDAMYKLSDRQKEIVYLKIFKGLSYDEIAPIMNINYQASRNLFSQAIKSLRQLLVEA
ncbi:MAG TPA: sigma-70 family RNA polymerase sigma factor [Bacteroidia bacterium]|nr:sigma-70 family RNA polymerase sigma factor [Bacteroidia bacterium]HND94577.1 sigma-70 family RNA polymerase sigma factor [Chitinophagaceae bacterium]